MSNVGLQFAEGHLQLVQLLILSARVPPNTAKDDDKHQYEQYEYADADNNCYHDYYHARLFALKPDVTDCRHLITQFDLRENTMTNCINRFLFIPQWEDQC